jgi:microcystin-dependent protein
LSAADAEFATVGQKYGEENHTLTTNEMPSHNHGIYVGTIDDKNWTGYSTSAGQYPPADAAGTYNTSLVTLQTGGGQSFPDVQPSVTQKYAIKLGAVSGTQPVPAGTSVSGYFTSTPSGYLYEDGSAVSRTTYAALFAAIGTTYGSGDGSTTFNVPDSRGRLGVNQNPTDAEFSTLNLKYGEKTHTLTIAEMPAHTHGLYVGTADDQNFSNLAGQYPPADGGGAYNTGETTAATGGGQAFNLIQPSIVKRFVIKY